MLKINKYNNLNISNNIIYLKSINIIKIKLYKLNNLKKNNLIKNIDYIKLVDAIKNKHQDMLIYLTKY